MQKKRSVSATVIILGSMGLCAQKQIDHQSLYWIRYYNQLSLDARLNWSNEIEDRRFLHNNRQHHLILHSRLHYKLNKNTDLGLGFTYSLQSPQDPESLSTLIVPEKRIVQEINLINPLSKRFNLSHRWRIDERFIHKNNGKALIPGDDFNFRFRYKLQCTYQLNKINSSQPTTIKIADEIMINAGKAIVYNTFDQNRISCSIEQRFTQALSAELGYIHWYQQRSSGYQFYSRDIIRFTLYHKINLKPSA